MHRAIVLAAGKGTRLVSGADFPKPMKRVAGTPLIVRVLRALERAGVDEVAIVVGYLGGVIVEHVRGLRLDLDVRFVANDDYEQPNGTSLLKAASFVDRPCFVLMSDHLFAPSLLDAVRAFPLRADEAVLGVDRRVDRCFDLEDATKVRLEGDRVVGIGKELSVYDAIDTGVFRVTPALVEALREAARGKAGCSLSEGVATLARSGRMRAVDVGGATWIDVDTPAAHRIAESLVARYGDDLGAPLDVPAARLVLGA